MGFLACVGSFFGVLFASIEIGILFAVSPILLYQLLFYKTLWIVLEWLGHCDCASCLCYVNSFERLNSQVLQAHSAYWKHLYFIFQLAWMAFNWTITQWLSFSSVTMGRMHKQVCFQSLFAFVCLILLYWFVFVNGQEIFTLKTLSMVGNAVIKAKLQP